jgi:hypothetical protein
MSFILPRKLILCLGFLLMNLCHSASAEEVLIYSATKGQKSVRLRPDGALLRGTSTFWVEVNESRSKEGYAVSAQEVINGRTNFSSPQIKVVGNLYVEGPEANGFCVVRLPAGTIQAQNQNGSTLILQLSGTIGNQPLSTNFVKPEFNELNETTFEIEGYIDPSSIASGLIPGTYEYRDQLKLIVECN